MRVRLDKDDIEDVYVLKLQQELPMFFMKTNLEIPDELYQRYIEAQEEWDSVQDELHDYWKEMYPIRCV